MRFFALSWAVLLPFYALQSYLRKPLPSSSPALSLIAEFLPTYSGVLLLQAAEPLWREVAHYFPMKEKFLHWIDQITERSLYLLVLPHAILFISGNHEEQFIRLLNLLLGVVAFIFIGIALRILTIGIWRSYVWLVFVLVMAVYSVAEAVWTYNLIVYGIHMTNKDIVGFAFSKVVFSAMFLTLVMSIPKNREPEQSPPQQPKLPGEAKEFSIRLPLDSVTDQP